MVLEKIQKLNLLFLLKKKLKEEKQHLLMDIKLLLNNEHTTIDLHMFRVNFFKKKSIKLNKKY